MIDEYVNKWIIKANNDLKVAENELAVEKKDMVTDAICFHTQQAVEKYLKAYLITKNVSFGRTHNLEFLLELCRKEDKEFDKLDVGNLSFYAVELRYPDEFYIPSPEEAEECCVLAMKIKEFIFEKLDIKKE